MIFLKVILLLKIYFATVHLQILVGHPLYRGFPSTLTIARQCRYTRGFVLAHQCMFPFDTRAKTYQI